ncbi:MAG: ATP-binding protein [Micrococcales bacterium]|nr:ATP-binding protein [Micrococcales bacterium]
MALIERPVYEQWIRSYVDTPVAKVLTGIRRCGKSSLLMSTADWLRQRTTPDRVVHLDFDLLAAEPLRSAAALDAHLRDTTPPDGPLYVLLDEVQEVDQWERLVNSLLAQGRADIYLTGSNSRMLSSELSTYITGRYVTVDVTTLSFAEHLDFAARLRGSGTSDLAGQFDAYLRQGGFPGLYMADYSDAQARQLVSDIYRSILVKDVLARHPIRNVDLFERVASFALDNVGNIVSARSISAFLKSQQRTLSHPTVAEYLNFLTEAYLLTKVSRYDLRGRALLATNEKYFAGDHGLINAFFGYSTARLPGLLENIVGAELARRGYDVMVGKQGDTEVDFVGARADEKVYVQVAATILDPATRRREYAPLTAIADSYPKYVVTLDQSAGGNQDGIRHVWLPTFLLDESW